jgi:hypothetical protein
LLETGFKKLFIYRFKRLGLKMVEYVLRDGDGNVISREDDAEDVGYNEDTSPDPEPEDDDSGGGGSDTGSNSTTEPVNEDQLNNEPLDIGEVKQPEDYNRENTDIDQTGPDTVEVKKSVTVEDQNTRVPAENGSTVSRADQITREAEAEENRRNLQETAEFLEQRGRETEAAEFREQARAARQQEKQLEQGIQEITELAQSNEAIQERNFRRQVNQFQRQNLEDQLGRPGQVDQEFSEEQRKIQEQINQFQQNNDIKAVPGQRTTPRPNTITAEGIDQPEYVFSTQREFGSGTNIPGESFLDRGRSFSGLQGTEIEGSAFANRAFENPGTIGLKTQRDTTDFLQNLGVNQQFSENFGRSVGATTTLGLGTVQGTAELPEDLQELAENPAQKIGSEAKQFSQANRGKIAETPSQAVLLADTSFQEQSRLGQEAVGAGLGLAGAGVTGFGIRSGGAVRGVNAPTFGSRSPDVEVERLDIENPENRISSFNAKVDREGNIRQDQQFSDPTNTRTFGIIGEDETVGTSTSGGQIFRVNDPEGERILLTDTDTTFKASDENVEGISRTDIIQIGEDQRVASSPSSDEVRVLDSQVEDFEFGTRSDQENVFTGDSQEFLNIETASAGSTGGQQFRGLTQAQVARNTDAGTIETFSTTKPGGIFSDRNRFDNDLVTGEGRFLEESVERPGIRRRFRLGDENEDIDSLTDLPEERQEELINDLADTGEEIFGGSTRRGDENTDTDTDIEEVDLGEDIETDSGQLLRRDRESGADIDSVNNLDQERLGLGTDRFASEAARKNVRDAVEGEFEGISPGSGLGVSTGGGLGLAGATDADTSDLTGIGTSERTDQGLNNFEDTSLGQIPVVDEDTDQAATTFEETDLDTTSFQEQEQDFFSPRRTGDPTPGFGAPGLGGGTGLPEGENDGNQESGLLDLFSRDQKRDLQRSVGADLLGLESEDLSETEATNPLSLRNI